MILAEIVADSVTQKGDRITTFELEYPRFVHCEFLTHRLFSRNAASSRAIPVKKMIEQVVTDPAIPVSWGKNQAGMQASEVFEEGDSRYLKSLWREAAVSAARYSEILARHGVHKQLANRLIEPFQTMNTVVTATEYDNFFTLRCHKDAQPEIQELANNMRATMEASEPVELVEGQWHTPYFNGGQWLSEEVSGCSLDDALKISASCCAQVSFRTLDDSLDKANKIFDKLIHSEPPHASPVEHQATPFVMNSGDGVSHVDYNNHFWSGNFKGWVQYRQLIQGVGMDE